VGGGQVPEPPPEPCLGRVVQVPLAAQEDDLVLEQSVPDDRDLVWRQVRAGGDAGDLGADVAGDLPDVDGCHAPVLS
jgi:hypothetical protein